MSMYNMLFGESSTADIVLSILNASRDDFGRFRDAYITENALVVHTRCGGGNREDYESVFEWAKYHPLYISDADDDFDCTYCNFYFSHPVELHDELRAFAMENNIITHDEKWKILINSLKCANIRSRR